MGTELARWIGLKTPDFALITLDERYRDFNPNHTIQNGPAFLSRYIYGEPYDFDNTFLDKLTNKDDIALLVVFDTWIRNDDRYSHNGTDTISIKNLDNLIFARHQGLSRNPKYDLMAIDHTHAFADSGFAGLDDENLIHDEKIYGLFPSFEPYITPQAVQMITHHLRQIDEVEIKSLLDKVPTEWGLTVDLNTKLFNLIIGRARFVSDSIETKLFSQRDLWEGGTEHGL